MKKNNVFTKILDIIIDVIVGLVFVVSLGVIIANVSAGENGNPNLFGYSAFSVQTDSMKGTIEEGDLIIGKILSSEDELKKGDIVTFRQAVNGQYIYNTHEIVEVEYTGSQYNYYTQGTNTPGRDSGYRTRDDIIAKYADVRLPGLGAFIDFLKEPIGFILCLALPMVLFIGYEIYKIVVMYMRNKKEEILEEAKTQTSDDVKDAIIKEYLASQKAQENSANKEPKKTTSKKSSSAKK